ncbi:MAG TPA: imidazole glycerol phosphate synthase subunit HisH [Sphingobacterium sp.]|nr:imidazole glycerol phosphate synthase subunit HisH [Sphingobacterium sp.]
MIGIVNYGAGNIFSLTAALDRIGMEYGMVNEKGDFDKYDRIIIPGVGHAGAAMQKLRDSGMTDTILSLKKPVLGICVGMQLMTSFSEEGDSELLSIVPMRTLHFGTRVQQKVPHMGWNSIQLKGKSPLFHEIEDNTYFYFVHSYFIESDPAYSIANCSYGQTFCASLQHDNFFGVQFHPEKSGKHGAQLLLNFSRVTL